MTTSRGSLTGTLELTRLLARLDRLRLLLWLLGLAALWSFWAASMDALYPTEAERIGHARILAGNAVARAIDGPASGSSLGALTMVESFAFMASLTGLMSILLVVRHTRVAEDAGWAELTAGGVVGRRARIAATLALAALANVALAVVSAGGLAVQGLDVAGSLAAGAALGAVGFSFACLTAVVVQVAGTARSARTIALGILVAAFALRAAGDAMGRVLPSGTDVESAWLSWVSPMGWGQQMRPFAADNWHLLGLFAVLAGVTIMGAFVLADRRDDRHGVLAPSRGRARGDARVRGHAGLVWRLQRVPLLATAAGLATIGATFGAIGEEADKIVGTSAQMQEALARLAAPTMVDAWFATTLGWIGALVAAYTVHALLRLRAEESQGLLEPVLVASVSRQRWLFGHAAGVLGGSGVLLLLVGVCAGLAFGAADGDVSGRLAPVLSAALVQFPAVVVVAGFVIAAFGFVPRFAPALSWMVLGVAVVLGPLGRVVDLPQTMLRVSPFSHVPAMPAVEFAAAPVLALLLVGSALAWAGTWAFGRRDVAVRRIG